MSALTVTDYNLHVNESLKNLSAYI